MCAKRGGVFPIKQQPERLRLTVVVGSERLTLTNCFVPWLHSYKCNTSLKEEYISSVLALFKGQLKIWKWPLQSTFKAALILTLRRSSAISGSKSIKFARHSRPALHLMCISIEYLSEGLPHGWTQGCSSSQRPNCWIKKIQPAGA